MTPWCLPQLLERAAESAPDAVAVVDGDRELSYHDLEARANQLAQHLTACGVGRGDRVAIYLPKSLESIIAVYGVMKSGAAYVPLDPQAPVARLAYITSNGAVRALVSNTRVSNNWPALLEATPSIVTIVSMDAEPNDAEVPSVGPEQLGQHADSPPGRELIGFDLAYVLYTSGSTGQPKGVMLSHLNALSFVRWAANEFGVCRDDRLSSHAPLHFDLSIFDVYAAAHGAATLVLVPPTTSLFPAKIASFIDDNAITTWYSVPSVLSMLVDRGGLTEGGLPSLRTILFAGEVFPTKYLRRLMALLPHVRFANLYGPTETNVCTWYDVPPLPEDHDDPVPIGRAIADDEVFAVDDDGLPVPPGAQGELLVRGATVMQGYWGDSERTAKSLVPDPRGLPGHAYRTGDLVVLRPDGDYEFCGRRDNQVKSRGYRIELGDIEAAAYSHPDVIECAAIAVPDDLVTNRIRLHAVVKGSMTPPELARYCADRLPPYMVPDKIVVDPALPKTSTGKIDRQALSGAEQENDLHDD